MTLPQDPASRVAKISIFAPAALEPFDTAAITADASDSEGRRVDVNELITWESSEPTIVLVDRGIVRAGSLGTAVVSATVGGVTARASINVAWRSDAILRFYPELGTLDPGVSVQLTAHVRSYLAPPPVVWSSSDGLVARVTTGGTVIAIGAGLATITARSGDLTASSTVRVTVDPLRSGFGYAYTGSVPLLEDYDVDVVWSPPETHAYSTSGIRPHLTFLPPYPTRPDFGWLQIADVRSPLLLHAVSLEGLRCRALVYVGFMVGAMTDCWDGRSGNRQETIAATPDAFTGPIAVIRPQTFTGPIPMIRPQVIGWTSSGDSIAQRTNARGWREYYAPGLSRENSYAFVTAAMWDPGGCAVAPNDEAVAQGTVTVLCANRDGALSDLPFYAILFGDSATRGGEARVFAELNESGAVTRRSEAGIRLTSTAFDRGAMTIALTGDAVAQHSRVPAVFLTTVSVFPQTRCWMTEPAGAGTPRVTFDVRCDLNAHGVLIGATY